MVLMHNDCDGELYGLLSPVCSFESPLKVSPLVVLKMSHVKSLIFEQQTFQSLLFDLVLHTNTLLLHINLAASYRQEIHRAPVWPLTYRVSDSQFYQTHKPLLA